MNKKQVIYNMGVLCILFKNIFSYTELVQVPESFSTILIFLGIFLFSICIIIEKEKLKNLILYGIIIIASIYVYIQSTYSSVLLLTFAVIAAKNLDLNKIISLIFKFYVLILLLHFSLYIVFYFFDIEFVNFNYRYSGETRHKFFFGHANYFSSIYIWTVLMFMYLKYPKYNILNYMFVVFSAFFVWFFPNSRTSSILLALALLMFILIKKKSISNKFVKKLLKNSVLICSIFCVFMISFYGKLSFIEKIDKLFNARIRLARAAYEYYGIHWFGTNLPILENVGYIKEFNLTSITIDSGYYCLLNCYGIVFFILFNFCFIKLANNTKLEKRDSIFIILWAIFALMETSSLNPMIAFPVLFLSKIISDKDSKNIRRD